jgi:hypothetical protein
MEPGRYTVCNFVYGIRLNGWWLNELQVDMALYNLIPPSIKYVHELQQWLRVQEYARRQY